MTPHERPIPGPAAEFAATLAAQLPVLQTPRLRLRAPRLQDFDAWAEILCGPSGPHLGGPFDRDAAFAEFAASCGTWLLRGHGLWTVEPKAGGDVLGFILIGFEPGDHEPELGYLFRPSATRQGYASEAAAAARDHGFATLGLHRLVSYIDPANNPSRRVAQRLGAAREGEVDGSEVWVHRPIAQRASHTKSHTESIRNPDAFQTSEKGD